ncbi:MAG: hypothetical protein COA36_16765 [Desulfotalea sp.]|nr:MAG: hypothetical protein COA36_16765 [Desulfotalea sp.]
MEIGDYANLTNFLNDKAIDGAMIKLIKETDIDFTFEIRQKPNELLTVSKNVGFDHTWYCGPNKTMKRRTLIEPF